MLVKLLLGEPYVLSALLQVSAINEMVRGKVANTLKAGLQSLWEESPDIKGICDEYELQHKHLGPFLSAGRKDREDRIRKKWLELRSRMLAKARAILKGLSTSLELRNKVVRDKTKHISYNDHCIMLSIKGKVCG